MKIRIRGFAKINYILACQNFSPTILRFELGPSQTISWPGIMIKQNKTYCLEQRKEKGGGKFYNSDSQYFQKETIASKLSFLGKYITLFVLQLN